MKKWFVLFLAGLLLVSLVIISCDDDDPLIFNDGPEYLVLGEVLMRPYVEVLGNIHPIYGQECDIDSIKFGDSLCTIAKSPYYVDGGNYNYSFSYRNQADSQRFSSGDVAPLRFYRGSEITTAFVKLLKLPGDSTNIVSPDYNESFAISADVPLVWSKIASADWYSVTYIYDTSNAFDAGVTYHYEYTTDTTFTIPTADHPTNGEYYIYIHAITGPLPGATGNIDSESITGSFYGTNIPGVSYGLRVIIGSGIPDVTVAQAKRFESVPKTLVEKFISDMNR